MTDDPPIWWMLALFAGCLAFWLLVFVVVIPAVMR